MVKDLKYFLDEENKFCEKHPNYGQAFYDTKIGEMSMYGIDDRLNYLTERIFSQYYKMIGKPLGKELDYCLSDIQRVLLKLFYCKHSLIFRDDYYYEGINEFEQNLFDTLDDVVKKAPSSCESKLYRFCNEFDPSDMNIGDVIEVPYNLTCTNYDWHQENFGNVYIITPLEEHKTRAHNLFEIYNHGNENQIDFLRNTNFLVTNIEKTQGTEYKKFYLDEQEASSISRSKF